MLKEYTTHLYAGGRAAGTVRQRLRHIDRLADLHPDLLAVTRTDLEAILAKMRIDGLEAETRKAARSSYRSFYGWAARTGLIAHDPSEDLDPVKVPVRIPRLAADDAVLGALAHAELRERTMILLARLACLRLTDLSTLHMSAREGDVLRVRGKGEKERLVYINDDLMRTLLEREHELGPDNYYFPGRFAAYMHPQSVNKIMTRRSDSTAPCYSELIVTDVFYQKAAMWGRSLRTSFMLRAFAQGTQEPTIRKTTGGNGLKIFPAKEGEDTTAADAELVSVFQKNFTEAAANFAKQAR